MFLKIAALLSLALFIAPALVIALAGIRQGDPLQVSPMYQCRDLSSLSVEEINRRTLKAAAAIKTPPKFPLRVHD